MTKLGNVLLHVSCKLSQKQHYEPKCTPYHQIITYFEGQNSFGRVKPGMFAGKPVPTSIDSNREGEIKRGGPHSLLIHCLRRFYHSLNPGFLICERIPKSSSNSSVSVTLLISPWPIHTLFFYHHPLSVSPGNSVWTQRNLTRSWITYKATEASSVWLPPLLHFSLCSSFMQMHLAKYFSKKS